MSDTAAPAPSPLETYDPVANPWGKRVSKSRSFGAQIEQEQESERSWLNPSGLEMPALQIIMRANQPVIVWGYPGEGKTASIEALAAYQNAHLEVLIGSQYSPTDIAGQAQIVGDRVEHIPPSWVSRVIEASEEGPTIVFFDELDKCPMQVQNACLRAVRERVVGHTRLPKDCRIIAAANPPYLGGWDLSAPMANRLVHLQWSLNEEVVLQGLGAGLWPQLDILDIHDEMLARRLARWRGIIRAFLAGHKDHIRQLPASESSQGRPWPSPRSWETLIAILSVADAADASDDIVKILIDGCVGTTTLYPLLNWIAPVRRIDPEQYLVDPESIPKLDQLDHQEAVVVSIAATLSAQPTQERLDQAIQCYISMYKIGYRNQVELGLRYLRQLASRQDLKMAA